jgi:hypothetical protein
MNNLDLSTLVFSHNINEQTTPGIVMIGDENGASGVFAHESENAAKGVADGKGINHYFNLKDVRLRRIDFVPLAAKLLGIRNADKY